MERFDVAIIGAGPAGASAAVELLERDPDRSVVLIEGVRRRNTLAEGEPGAGHSMCSGGLGRAMLEAIGWQIPREARMADVHRVLLQTRNTTVELSGEQLGFEGPIAVVTNRKRFDDWLLGKAMDLGAHYEPGTRVRATARQSFGTQSRWHIETNSGRTFAARALVGADGPESAIAKAHLAAPPVPADDMYLATEVYVRSTRFPKDAMMARFQTSRIMGYYWAFSAGEVVKVGCGSSVASGKQVSRETSWWREQLATQYADSGFTGRPLEHVGGRITCARPLVRVADAGSQVAVVGEAARAVLASIGAGDASAVESGRALGRALAAGDLSQYQRWWQGSMRRFLKRHYRLKRMILSMSDEELDRLARAMASYRPLTTNARVEVPRFFLYLLRKQGLLMGRVAVRAALH